LRDWIEEEGNPESTADSMQKYGFKVSILNEISPCHKIVQVIFFKKSNATSSNNSVPKFAGEKEE